MHHHIGSKRNHNMLCIITSCHPSYSTKSLKIISKKKVNNDNFFCLSLTNLRHPRSVCRHFKNKIQVLLLYIKTLYKAMVIDFLMFTSRPSTRQWLLIFLCLHQNPLLSNGYWFPFFTLRPSAKQYGHQFLYIKALREAMVIDFFVTLRPFTW